MEKLICSKGIYTNGTENDDTITGSAYIDHIYGCGGNDTIYGDAGSDWIFGDSGNDTIDGGNNGDYIIGGDGDDTLNGGNGNDTIFGGNEDEISIKAGNNTINGGAGNDSIVGNLGNDIIHGDDGNDYIYDYGGNNFLYGDDGNDDINGGDGDDTIYGGKGNDTLNGGTGNNTYHFKANEGSDKILYGGGNDSLIFDGETNINNIMFSHYLTNKDNENNTDYISVVARNNEGTVLNSINVDIYGSTEGCFELDKYATASQISIGKENSTFYNLTQITQYVDMETANKAINISNAGGILNVAKDIYIKGTNENDSYSFNTSTVSKQVTINDTGGNDVFYITENAKADSFRFFFDVDKTTGKVKGTDLYIMSMSNGGTVETAYNNSSLYNYVVNQNTNVSYIRIENFFDGNGNAGTGRIEDMRGADKKICNIDSCIDDIRSDIATWLSSKPYTSVMDAIENGTADARGMLIDYFVTDSVISETVWNNYWT